MQTTLRDILYAALRESLKVESVARSTREVQRPQGELAVDKSEAKAAGHFCS